MKLIFPCGARYDIPDGQDELLLRAHRAKDGAFRILVYPGSAPYDEKRQHEARCDFECPTRRRRKVERGYDAQGNLRYYISCHGRLIDDGTDVTPPRPDKCPHCEEQKAYVRACKRAAKHREPIPRREDWGPCPQCKQYRELTLDTGLCASCQLAEVVEANR